jgi:hypothetical protein
VYTTRVYTNTFVHGTTLKHPYNTETYRNIEVHRSAQLNSFFV